MTTRELYRAMFSPRDALHLLALAAAVYALAVEKSISAGCFLA